MKHCDKYRGLIPLYDANELDGKTAAKLKKHISKCHHCAALLDAQRVGKLYIISSDDNGAKKRSRLPLAIALSAAALCLILIAAAFILRGLGFVRIASVETEELSSEYVLSQQPDLFIDARDLVLALGLSEVCSIGMVTPESEPKPIFLRENNELPTEYYTDGTRLFLRYKTMFRAFCLSWAIDEEPTVETMSKSISARFGIFDIIKETRYINRGNEYYEKYTATLDLWGTLTRQELG